MAATAPGIAAPPSVPARRAGRAGPAAAPPVAAPLYRRIAAMLCGVGRRAVSDIAGVLGVSKGRVRNRVRAIRRDGQVRIVALVDPVAVETVTGLCGVTHPFLLQRAWEAGGSGGPGEP